ncbi:tetratricopeptide repeat protein [Nocardioides yefusunii]|uniref:Tetratricopeptide repeat protein n=1 Tax=Nocardioides yefusunii TaxID=2500546 RepID=A0ABW1QUI9_9ACTN|nr:tetratricopeptide repeat protein [Nocardioides yefusunii]
MDIGCDLADRGDVEGAQHYFERASALGDAAAAFNLGNCLAEQGLSGEAVAAYDLAIEPGETNARLNLGSSLGDLGDAHAHHNLAVLLQQRGDFVGAKEHFREAAARGDTLAAKALRDLLGD